MLKSFGPYSKFVTGVVGQALTYATLYYGGNKYVAAAVAVASALGSLRGAQRPKRPGPAAVRAADGNVTATAGLFGWFQQVTQELAQIQAQLTAQGRNLTESNRKKVPSWLHPMT